MQIRNFSVLCLLGQGSFAKVYLLDTAGATCCPQSLRNLRALKMISKESLALKDYFEYIKDEKQIMIDLKHPFLLELHLTFQC